MSEASALQGLEIAGFWFDNHFVQNANRHWAARPCYNVDPNLRSPFEIQMRSPTWRVLRRASELRTASNPAEKPCEDSLWLRA